VSARINDFQNARRRGGHFASLLSHLKTIRWRRVVSNHPVCAFQRKQHFIDGAATPPSKGGEISLSL
jgi:hypothetical protein